MVNNEINVHFLKELDTLLVPIIRKKKTQLAEQLHISQMIKLRFCDYGTQNLIKKLVFMDVYFQKFKYVKSCFLRSKYNKMINSQFYVQILIQFDKKSKSRTKMITVVGMLRVFTA